MKWNHKSWFLFSWCQNGFTFLRWTRWIFPERWFSNSMRPYDEKKRIFRIPGESAGRSFFSSAAWAGRVNVIWFLSSQCFWMYIFADQFDSKSYLVSTFHNDRSFAWAVHVNTLSYDQSQRYSQQPSNFRNLPPISSKHLPNIFTSKVCFHMDMLG